MIVLRSYLSLGCMFLEAHTLGKSRCGRSGMWFHVGFVSGQCVIFGLCYKSLISIASLCLEDVYWIILEEIMVFLKT